MLTSLRSLGCYDKTEELGGEISTRDIVIITVIEKLHEK